MAGGACSTTAHVSAPFRAGGGRATLVAMRIERSVTSISWIPSEAVRGSTKLPFSVGMAHYDDAPPDSLDGGSTVDAPDPLRGGDRFRVANHLSAWIEVEDGRITASGQTGNPMIGGTT